MDSKKLNIYEDSNQMLKKELKRLERLKRKEERTLKSVLLKFIKVSTITLSIFLITMIVTAVGLFFYLNQSVFDNSFQYISSKEYFKEQGFNAITYKNPESINLMLDERAFNSVLLKNKEAIMEYLPFDYHIIDLKADLNNKMIRVNGRMGITLCPMSSSFEMDVENDQLKIRLKDFHLGAKELKIPEVVTNLVLGKDNRVIAIPLEQLDIFPNYVKIKNIFLNPDTVIYNTSVDVMVLSDGLKTSLEEYDPLIYEYYTQHQDDEAMALSLRLVDEQSINQEDSVLLINDLFGQQSKLDDIIVSLDIGVIKELYSQYGHFINQPLEEIMAKKSEILIQKKIEVANILLLQLNDYLTTNSIYYISDFGKIYDVENQSYINANFIRDYYVMPNEAYKDEISNSMLYYDTTQDEIMVKSKLNDDQVLIVSKDYYEVLNKVDTDKKYPEGDTQTNIESPGRESEIALAIKDSILSYKNKNQGVYFRYLKTDGGFAYAIVSFENTYQSIQAFVLQKIDDQWSVLNENASYSSINTNYPDFNVKLLPPYDYKRIQIKQISIYGKQSIVDQLRLKDSYTGGSISFCSYIGDYVYIQLSNGNEFVIYVKEGRLTEVLPRDKAEEEWNLSPLLMVIE